MPTMIDPDIRQAETLSSEFYTAERYFHESKEKIFARSWQLAATLDEINNIKPHTLLENFLDEPILISKDADENLHCLSNVCTHRGKILIEKDCRANGFRCAYHGRRFALDGKFLSMPEFENVANFPTEKDNLSKIPLADWGKFLFVSINPFAPLMEFIAPMNDKLPGLRFDKLKLVSTCDYKVKAHWALYCENYLEGFHIPYVHQSLNEVIDYASYTTETFRFSSLQTALSASPDAAGSLMQTDALFSNKNIAAYYFFIFPNMMFNFYPWGLSLNIIKPQTPELTIVSYLTYVSDETRLKIGAGADLNRVELEDQTVVESVQKGLRSRFYDKGRYSPSREQGTHHFHRLIAEFMS